MSWQIAAYNICVVADWWSGGRWFRPNGSNVRTAVRRWWMQGLNQVAYIPSCILVHYWWLMTQHRKHTHIHTSNFGVSLALFLEELEGCWFTQINTSTQMPYSYAKVLYCTDFFLPGKNILYPSPYCFRTLHSGLSKIPSNHVTKHLITWSHYSTYTIFHQNPGLVLNQLSK